MGAAELLPLPPIPDPCATGGPLGLGPTASSEMAGKPARGGGRVGGPTCGGGRLCGGSGLASVGGGALCGGSFLAGGALSGSPVVVVAFGGGCVERPGGGPFGLVLAAGSVGSRNRLIPSAEPVPGGG